MQINSPEVSRAIHLVSVRGRKHTAPVGAFVMAAKQHPWPGRAALDPGPTPASEPAR